MCLGIPGQITQILDPNIGTAQVVVSGVKREVNLGCVMPDDGDLQALVGRWTLIHVGFAMSLIDEEEAEKTLKVLAELGALQEELSAIQDSEVN